MWAFKLAILIGNLYLPIHFWDDYGIFVFQIVEVVRQHLFDYLERRIFTIFQIFESVRSFFLICKAWTVFFLIYWRFFLIISFAVLTTDTPRYSDVFGSRTTVKRMIEMQIEMMWWNSNHVFLALILKPTNLFVGYAKLFSINQSLMLTSIFPDRSNISK